MEQLKKPTRYSRARKKGWLTVAISVVPIIVEIITRVLQKTKN